MARLDPHSYHDTEHAQTEAFDLRVTVDFERRLLEGQVTVKLAPSPARERGGALDLDTRDLSISGVEGSVNEGAARDGWVKPLEYQLAQPDPVLGERLRVTLPAGTEQVTIHYRTSDLATALGWLAPAQTASKRYPYLFSQCQAIHARSIVPLQDSPRCRVTYTASLDVPEELTSLMAARFIGRLPGSGGRAIDRWEMPQPVPPYLLALAVGDVVSRDLSPRVRIWAEPPALEAAAREFDGVEPMIDAAERLFGPYDWERFDLLVMPPSFPYGGMENPRLTFLTPTIIAGDRSLVNVVAHELSHSWTGNLVSNASAEHFWLNEGFTVYAERRIIEATQGLEEAELHAAVGRKELLRVLEELALHPELTRLRGHLDGIDPDHAFSIVPYEKGYLMLRAIEQSEGRQRWDQFLREYMRAFRFRALTTEEWLDFLELHLPGAAGRAGVAAYLHSPGLPASAPVPRSARLDRVLALPPGVPAAEQGAQLTPLEWRLYLDHMPRPSPAEVCAALEERFGLSQSQNAEILSGWLELALESGYAPALPRAVEFLGEVGRMKYLKPLYKALLTNTGTFGIAKNTYTRHVGGYHPIARHVVESLFAAAGCKLA